VLAEFGSAVDAARCSIEAQVASAKANLLFGVQKLNAD
jgi:hypothetical protein